MTDKPNKMLKKRTRSGSKVVQKSKRTKKRKNETREFEQHVDDMEANVVQSDEDEGRHAALLQSIRKLDGKKGAITQRSTNAVHVSEFISTNSGTDKKSDGDTIKHDKVKLDSLLTALDKSSKVGSLKNQFNKTNTNTNKLPTPREKIHQDKLERQTAYRENQLQVHKWQTVIEENRKLEHQHFPLVQNHIKVPTAKESLRMYVPRNQMEIEIQTLLKGPNYDPSTDPALQPKIKLSFKEEKRQKAMDLRAAREEHQMMRKHRLMISNVASKNKRQKKIKSRAYHRHMRASRRKEAFKELEKLRQSDPEAFKQKAEEIEKERIEERGTMRHKSNKYGKLAKRYGKFNDKIKESLDEMHSQAAKLMEKKTAGIENSESGENSDSDDSVTADLNMNNSDDELPAAGEDNPWMTQKAAKKHSKSHSKAYHRPQPVQAAPPVADDSESEMDEDNIDTQSPDSNNLHLAADSEICEVYKPLDSSEDEHEEIIIHRNTDVESVVEDANVESSIKLTTREDVEQFDAQFHADTADSGQSNLSESDIENNEGVSESLETKQKEVIKDVEDIDLNKVMKTVRSSNLTNKSLLTNDNSDSETTDNKMNIQQAFIDDDVVEEFEQKRDEVYGAGKKAVSSFQLLPGWGQWGGEGLKPKKLRWSEQQKLKEKELENSEANRIKKFKHPYAIINEEAINSLPIAKYQPTKVEEEKTHRGRILKPISREWIAETEHKTLIKPRLTTTVGAIIEPIDKSQVMEKKKTAALKYNDEVRSTQYKLNNRKKFKPGVRKYDVERIASLF